MTVRKLIAELKKQDKNLQVDMFCHDQNPEMSDEGVGGVSSVDETIDENGRIFVALIT